MSLLSAFIAVLNKWRPAFSSKRSFQRAKDYAFGMLGHVGPKKTLTNVAIVVDDPDKKPSAVYKFFSLLKWKSEDLFNPIIEACTPFFTEGFIVVGVDDSKFKKTGKHIPGASWHRDPMSPAFHANLIWGLRFLQFSLLMPLYSLTGAPCRAIPIRFADAPPIKKPGKKASADQRKAYVQAKMSHNLSTVFLEQAKRLRDFLNRVGQASLRILFVCDGSFCNTLCMNMLIPNCDILARCRKNAVLCFAEKAGRRRYAKKKFTPEGMRKDENIAYRTGNFHYGNQRRPVSYKEVLNVLWQRVTKTRPLRLIVIAPIPYIRAGRKSYREPGYLLTTDLITPVEKLIQAYLDRIQIEYNFRDEKSILGVGEAQVRNDKSVHREPAFTVAVYSALLLSSLIRYGDTYTADRQLLPEWRELPKRPSFQMLRRELIDELRNNPEKILRHNLTEEMILGIMRRAA